MSTVADFAHFPSIALFNSGADASKTAAAAAAEQPKEPAPEAAPESGSSSSSSGGGGSWPAHEVMKMPALSPTMSAGNIVSWQKKVGDSVAPGKRFAVRPSMRHLSAAVPVTAAAALVTAVAAAAVLTTPTAAGAAEVAAVDVLYMSGCKLMIIYGIFLAHTCNAAVA